MSKLLSFVIVASIIAGLLIAHQSVYTLSRVQPLVIPDPMQLDRCNEPDYQPMLDLEVTIAGGSPFSIEEKRLIDSTCQEQSVEFSEDHVLGSWQLYANSAVFAGGMFGFVALYSRLRGISL